MDFIWLILIGLVIGALAKVIMPGRDPGGIIVTILLGIVGSIIGGYLAGALGTTGPTGRFILGIIGALLLLLLYRLVAKPRTV
jgi:uncharacterized membrane protein YeaQ/YmgE (transglycosylase-associated protein family)